MERIQIDRTKSLRARTLRKAQVRAEGEAPLAYSVPGGPAGDDDLMARIDVLLHDQRRDAEDPAGS